jgi:hypothetical protein
MNYPSFSSKYFIFLGLLSVSLLGRGQMITGVWHGKINRQKVEVKIVQNGDSLTGTSYYYESSGTYRRYSIKGYFDPQTNSAVWWDDQLLEERSGRFNLSVPGKVPLLARADFNCPGDGRMMLDGKAAKKENDKPAGDLHLDKAGPAEFPDEWDYIIENYTTGANDPEIIDSIAALSSRPENPEESPVVIKEEPVTEQPVAVKPAPKQPPVETKTEPPPVNSPPVKTPTIEEKFASRKKILIKEIPLAGDSVELRFYDNAEIDGDSISLFLNDKLIFEHIKLTATAYTIKLAVSELRESNELVMVAENLGSIPPNTSYMLAIVEDTRHEAFLSSTEGSSAVIRFTKQKKPAP